MRSIRKFFRHLFRRSFYEATVYRYMSLPLIVGALPNNIANGQTEDAVPVMANYNWIVNQVNANAAQLSLTPQLAGNNAFTGNMTIGGTLGVTGVTSLNGAVNVGGALGASTGIHSNGDVQVDTVIELGGAAARSGTAGTHRFDIFNGVAPTGTLANGVSLYATGGKLFAMDAGGSATQLTP